MKKIFLDANVIISVLNKEYPLFRMSSRVLSLSEHPSYTLCTSATSLAITFYFAGKVCGIKRAKEKIGLLCGQIAILETGQNEVNAALSNKKISDFEDGLQHYAAKHAGCHYIITEDQNDFFFSDVPVMSCEQFLREIVLSSKEFAKNKSISKR